MLTFGTMNELNASNPLALRFLMTEDIFIVKEEKSHPDDTGQEKEIVFDYLGGNNKFLLLIINDAEHANLQSRELEALEKILVAKRMNLKDVAIVNQRKYPNATWKELKSFFACSSVVLFGVDPSSIKIRPLPRNAITDFEGMQVLSTYSFVEMEDNVDKKREFWNQMKKL